MVKFVTLQVKVNNFVAINLYKNLGFEVTTTLKDYYKIGEDGYLMVLNFK